MIFCRAIELKSSEPILAQDRLVSRSSYIKCSNSAHFFSSRSRVEPKNESILSGLRASSFTCSPSHHYSNPTIVFIFFRGSTMDCVCILTHLFSFHFPMFLASFRALSACTYCTCSPLIHGRVVAAFVVTYMDL